MDQVNINNFPMFYKASHILVEGVNSHLSCMIFQVRVN